MEYRLSLESTISSFTCKDLLPLNFATLISRVGVLVTAEIPDFYGTKFSTAFQNVSIREALDEFVRQNPLLQWKEDGGVVRISPISASTGSLVLLDSSLPSFSSSGLDVTWTTVLAASDFREAGFPVVGGSSRTAAVWQTHKDMTRHDAAISIAFDRPASFREILDSIIKADPPAFWIASTVKDGRLIIYSSSAHEHLLPSEEMKRIRAKKKPLSKKALPGAWKQVE